MKNAIRWAAACLLLSSPLAIGCASGAAQTPARDPATAPPVTNGAEVGHAHGCPLGLPGVTVVASDTPGGVELTFAATQKEKVDELRIRVRESAEQHGPGKHEGLGHGGAHGTGHMHGLRLSEMPPLKATASDSQDGAKITLMPTNPATLDDLRAQAKDRAAKLSAGECPP